MKLILVLLLLVVSVSSIAQELPSNFTYKRETGQETGIPMFTLNVNDDAVAYDGENGSEFEALGAVVQPERDKYGLMFWNAKQKYQFSLLKKLTATIKIDDQEFQIAKALPTARKKVGALNMEVATLVIDSRIFWKLCSATEVIVRVGPVAYNLDEDNIRALRYFAAEIKKDLNRRNKNLPE